MDINPIRTEAEYRVVLKEISTLVDVDPDLDTPARNRLNALVLRAQAYESLCVPVDLDQPLPPELDDVSMP